MSANGKSYSSSWTREQDKAFEIALATFSKDSLHRWEKIAAMVPGKTVEEIKCHYVTLVEDINAIESDHVPLPCYDNFFHDTFIGSIDCGVEGSKFGNIQSNSSLGGKSSKSDQERRKGIAWTEEEHRLFLEGLEKYGKGDWRSISRYFVVSRTPTQVASHAQKYFIRLNSSAKERRRPSIHDITSARKGKLSTSPQPVTEQTGEGEAASGSSYRKSGQPALSRGTDVSNFVPPTIVQSSTDSPPVIAELVTQMDVELVSPMDVPSQAEIVYGVKALTPGSIFSG